MNSKEKIIQELKKAKYQTEHIIHIDIFRKNPLLLQAYKEGFSDGMSEFHKKLEYQNLKIVRKDSIHLNKKKRQQLCFCMGDDSWREMCSGCQGWLRKELKFIKQGASLK